MEAIEERPAKAEGRLPTLTTGCRCPRRLRQSPMHHRSAPSFDCASESSSGWWGSLRKLADDQLLARHSFLKRSMFGWIGYRQRAADDRDRAASVVDCRHVRRPVDAFGEPAHNQRAVLGQQSRELCRSPDPSRRRLPGSDNGDSWVFAEPFGVAGDEEMFGSVTLLQRIQRSEEFFRRRRALRHNAAL